MSLRERIVKTLKKEGRGMSMGEIYDQFPQEKRTTVRGRVYNALGKGITKVGKGLYISSDAIIEHGNSLEIVDRLVAEGDKFDFIFLDIPYKAAGQRSGPKEDIPGAKRARNMFELDTISVEQFGEFVQKLESLLRTDNSPLAFMFTSGKSSKKEHDAYMSQFELTGLKKVEQIGTFMKLWPNGRRMNMGKYDMPVENIYFYSKSGVINGVEDWILDFQLVPDIKLYPTAKPYPMIKTLVEQSTKIGGWVFDPFGGSGVTLQACLDLGRKCHIIDCSDKSIQNHILKIT